MSGGLMGLFQGWNLFGGGSGGLAPTTIIDKEAAKKALLENSGIYKAKPGVTGNNELGALFEAVANNDAFLQKAIDDGLLTSTPVAGDATAPGPGGVRMTYSAIDITKLAREAKKFAAAPDGPANPAGPTKTALGTAVTALEGARFALPPGSTDPKTHANFFKIDTSDTAPSEFVRFKPGEAGKTSSTGGTLMNFLPLLAMLFMDFPTGLIVAAIGMLGMFSTGAGQGIANALGMGAPSSEGSGPPLAPGPEYLRVINDNSIRVFEKEPPSIMATLLKADGTPEKAPAVGGAPPLDKPPQKLFLSDYKVDGTGKLTDIVMHTESDLTNGFDYNLVKKEAATELKLTAEELAKYTAAGGDKEKKDAVVGQAIQRLMSTGDILPKAFWADEATVPAGLNLAGNLEPGRSASPFEADPAGIWDPGVAAKSLKGGMLKPDPGRALSFDPSSTA